MSVAPRWKRRADEIAEAIGDELSINGTVSVGNDVNLSVATITALANAITYVLNPSSIAHSIWNDAVADLTATSVHVSSIAGYWSITNSGGTIVGNPNVITNSSGTGTLEGIDYTAGTVFMVNQIAINSISNIWKVPGQQARNVSVLSTNTTPVHVQVRNIAGGFTSMGSDISTSMKLSAQPVSIADSVNVKTATNEAVAITGTVNANVGGITLPISNPNNITVPVVNSANVTVPVNVGSATVPVRASANGTPQNSSGVNVLVPVNPTHSVTVPVSAGSTTVPASVPSGLTVPVSVPSGLTVPVAVGGATVPAYVPNTLTVPASVPSGLTVPVAVGSNTVPVAVGSATVPVAVGSVVVPVENTNNVTVPVTSSGTVLDVNIKTVEASAKTQFHEAMETALNDANDIDVSVVSSYGTISGTHSGGVAFTIIRDDGTAAAESVYEYISGVKTVVSLSASMTATRVFYDGTDWFISKTIDAGLSVHGIIHWNNSSSSTVYDTWEIIKSDSSSTGYTQIVYDNSQNYGALGGKAPASQRANLAGREVVFNATVGFWYVKHKPN